MATLRIQHWTSMGADARRQLMHRGLDNIFDPALRRSIGDLIDDVRDRGDDAVCDALGRFDRIEIAPDQLRISDDEFDAANVSAELDAAIDDAISRWQWEEAST